MKSSVLYLLRRAMIVTAFACLLPTLALAGPKKHAPTVQSKETASHPALVFRELRYDGRLSDDRAQFAVEVLVESSTKEEVSQTLFEGELALLPAKLPDSVRLERRGSQYRLFLTKPGLHRLKLELVEKITRAEPWNQISFTGPPAAIASVSAQAVGTGVELQLLSGTLLEATQTNGLARIKGVLGSDQTVALRWSVSGGTPEVARKAVITAETSATAQITPTVIKYVTQVRYDIIQGKARRLSIALPASQALTRLAGEQIRDWEIHAASAKGPPPNNEDQLTGLEFSNRHPGSTGILADSDVQILEVEFLKPLEHEYQLTLFSEQTVESAFASAAAPTQAGSSVATNAAGSNTTSLTPPQPLGMERESGLFTISTEDTLAEIASASGLRQVNAPAGALAAYRFNGRPFNLELNLKRIEPVIEASERITARVEETRLVVSHTLWLDVKKAGIYAADLLPQAGSVVAEVRGEGVEDWKLTEASRTTGQVLHVNFSSRVLGARKVEVQVEQPYKTFPEQVTIGPLRIAGAAKESAQVGVAPAPGIQLKTAELIGLREIPVRALQRGDGPETTAKTIAGNSRPTTSSPQPSPPREEREKDRSTPGQAASSGWLSQESLAYSAEQADWLLRLATERMAARIVVDIFNLVTIGDGIVGGSATIRYGVLNQGAQEFELAVPATWKNVEFTGANIRRKESKGDGHWTIGLQDKAWGGYTLVVTYDYQFDPKGATLPMAGVHAVGVERETGSVAITTAASLKLNVKTASEQLRRVDEADLAATDRAMITRAVLLAYQYAESGYELAVEVKRFDELPVLAAVADRTQLTTALTDAGELLTQATFMVKNNDKQFQRFKLPAGARFWSCYVNGQAVKAERDHDWLLAPLPRGANRDAAFAVDIVYAENKSVRSSLLSGSFQLEAPQSDVPNTYAEWELFVPAMFRLSGFGGNMTVARGTTYDLRDSWKQFVEFYRVFLNEAGEGLAVVGFVALLTVALVGSAIRRGWSGVIAMLGVVCILALLSAMLLPALSRAKARAQRINCVNNLKQIGWAVRTFALDNGDRFPVSFEEMMNELSTEKVTVDPDSGQRFVYLGSGLNQDSIDPQSVIAFSPVDTGYGRNVLLADGSVQQVSSSQFAGLERRGFILRLNATQVAQNQQAAAVREAQLGEGANPPAAMPAQAPAAGRVHSLRIEVPRAGQAFVFTKVLNAGREPLLVRASMMKLRTFQTLQMVLQVGTFVAGLFVWWWQWRASRNSFVLALALALMCGSVGSLLMAWRLLHVALIIAAPLLGLAALGWLTWKLWPRKAASVPEVLLAGEAGAGPAVAAFVLALFLAMDSLQASETASASIASANYTGSVNERVAQLEASFQVVAMRPNEQLRLFEDDVAVQQFSAKPGDVKLVREGKGVAVVLPRAGQATVQVKLLVKLCGGVTRRELAFAIPPALTSQLSVVLDQPEADVEFPGAVSFQRTAVKQQTRVEAIIGSGDRVALTWTPRVKRAAEIAANVVCHNSTLVTFGNGVIAARATLDYQITQGEMRQIRVRLPAGYRLLRVEGEFIRTWAITGQTSASSSNVNPTVVAPGTKVGAAEILSVELLKGVAPGYRLAIETEKDLGPLPALIETEVPRALEVKRETGMVALRTEEDLEMAVEGADELYRVNGDEFERVAGQKLEGPVSAYRYLQPEFGLYARVATMQPQIEASVKNQVHVSSEEVRVSAAIDYAVKRAGVFALDLAIPAGYRIERITGNALPLQGTEATQRAQGRDVGSVAGNDILQWTERAEAQGPARVVEVAFKQRMIGNWALRVELTQSLKELPRTLAILGVHPLGTQKLTGFVSVSAEAGVAIKPAGFEDLTEIPATAIPGNETGAGSSMLAYKFIANEPRAAAPWKLSIATEAVESWVRAEIVNTLTLSETLVSGRALARFEIQNAPVRELRLRIPAEFRNVEISAPNIRRRDQEGEVWKIEFQTKIRGPHTLTVTWEQPRSGRTNLLELRGIGADGVERETGVLAIVARPPLQVSEQSTIDLKAVDTRELPEWAGRPDEAAVLAFRYLRPGYKLAVEARRFDEAEQLQALADSVGLSTVVAEDGQMMTALSLSVRNHGRQHLEIALPAGATVWSAFVAGQPVRPSVRESKLLLPLEQAGDEGPITVELTYVGTNLFPKIRGAVELVSPQMDMPMKSARWELFLPPDYRYSDFGGTMARETPAAAAEASVFSLFEYSKRESDNRAEQDKALQSQLSSAKAKLSKGQIKEAWADYSRAKSQGNFAGAKDTKELENELRRAQGSNLIIAQNEFNLNNGAPAAGQVPAAPGIQATQYDAAAAEAQWTKLEQAQELALARIEPIHVNLPTRGLRHVFSQVLQTEINRPLTVRLLAVNDKMISWPKRLGAGVAGFLMLWLGVSMMTRRAGHREIERAAAP